MKASEVVDVYGLARKVFCTVSRLMYGKSPFLHFSLQGNVYDAFLAAGIRSRDGEPGFLRCRILWFRSCEVSFYRCVFYDAGMCVPGR